MAIVRGGFSELYANADIDHVAYYNSYLATCLEREVRTLANVGNLRDFERFLRACALRSANLLNKVLGTIYFRGRLQLEWKRARSVL
jgi:uncharacterized protein